MVFYKWILYGVLCVWNIGLLEFCGPHLENAKVSLLNMTSESALRQSNSLMGATWWIADTGA